VKTQTLAVYSMGSYSCMGSTLALSPDQTVLAVGAYCHNNYDGSVYVFTADGTGSWSAAAVLNAGENAVNSLFGYSLALNDNFLFAGAYGDGKEIHALLLSLTVHLFLFCTTDRGAGVVAVFDISSLNGSLGIATDLYVSTVLQLPEPAESDWFGSSLTLEGEILVVAATGSGLNGQTVNIFVPDADVSGQFVLVQTLAADNLTRLGVPLTLVNGNLLMGSMQGHSAIIFELGPTNTSAPTAAPSSMPTTTVTAIPTSATNLPSTEPTTAPSPMPSTSSSVAPSGPTFSPTVAAQVAFSTLQVLNGVNYTTFNETSSAGMLSLRQTVATAVNSLGVDYTNVIINSVTPTTTSPVPFVRAIVVQATPAVSVAYTVSTTNAVGFSSSDSAFTQYSTNINSYVLSGSFDTTLEFNAETNAAAGMDDVVSSVPTFVPLLPTASPTPAPTGSPISSNSSSSNLSGGEVAGIVIAAVVLFAAGLVAAFYCLKRGASRNDYSTTVIGNQQPAPYVPPPINPLHTGSNNPNSAF
jgi:hypothetical protein